MQIYTIYKATNISNNKCYIGFDSHWPKRKHQHFLHSQNYNDGSNYHSHFHKAIRKYGFDAFIWQPIYQSKQRDHTLKQMERYFIEQYDSFNNGYNSTLGGEGTFGRKLTEQHKQILSERMQNNVIGTKFEKGRRSPNKDQNLTEQHKQNIAKSLKGKQKSADHKAALSKAKLGKKLTTKHKQNIRSALQQKWLVQYNNQQLIIDNLKIFCQKNNISYTYTIDIIKGRYPNRKTVNGYKISKL